MVAAATPKVNLTCHQYSSTPTHKFQDNADTGPSTAAALVYPTVMRQRLAASTVRTVKRFAPSVPAARTLVFAELRIPSVVTTQALV